MGNLVTLSFDAVYDASVTCSGERGEDWGRVPAPALEGVADAAQDVAPKLTRRLLDLHGAELDSVQAHGCSNT